MSNYFIQTDTYNPWWNLAVEKYLADRIQPGDVLLYLWQNENTVVIGRNQNALRECRAQLLEEQGGRDRQESDHAAAGQHTFYRSAPNQCSPSDDRRRGCVP